MQSTPFPISKLPPFPASPDFSNEPVHAAEIYPDNTGYAYSVSQTDGVIGWFFIISDHDADKSDVTWHPAEPCEFLTPVAADFLAAGGHEAIVSSYRASGRVYWG